MHTCDAPRAYVIFAALSTQACLQLLLYAVQDPEGILRAPQGDHISRRTMSKQIEDNKEMQEDLRKREAELKREMEETRQVCFHFQPLPCTVCNFASSAVSSYVCLLLTSASMHAYPCMHQCRIDCAAGKSENVVQSLIQSADI